MELTKKAYSAIDSLSKEGNTLMNDDNFDAAIEKWTQAIDLLPEPKTEWEAFMWLSASIGDAHYQQKRHAFSLASFQDAFNAPGGIEKPFIHYRMGQCQVALGNINAGIGYLLKAYMLDGEDIFLAEDDGPAFLRTLQDQNLIS